jgi:Polymer-forming cytoskeletal
MTRHGRGADKSGNGVLHRLRHVDRRQDRMQWSSSGLRPNRRRVARLSLLISDGAHIEGNVVAQNVTVCGRVTIRALRVKLQNGGAVEGDIFHRSLSIDENSQFEGSSRRVENPTDLSSSVDAKGPQKKDVAPAPLPSIDAELADGPKH